MALLTTLTLASTLISTPSSVIAGNASGETTIIPQASATIVAPGQIESQIQSTQIKTDVLSVPQILRLEIDWDDRYSSSRYNRVDHLTLDQNSEYCGQDDHSIPKVSCILTARNVTDSSAPELLVAVPVAIDFP